MDLQQKIGDLVPEDSKGRMGSLAEVVHQAYRENNLGDNEIDILYEELSGKGKPEFPIVGIPHGDFYQRLGDRWVQTGTEKESLEEDHNDTVSLYTIRRRDYDFIRDDHQEMFPGKAGETARNSIDSFDNTFSDMGKASRAFMEYSAERKDNKGGLDEQEWYNNSFELDEDVIEAFDYLVERTQSSLRDIFNPEDDTITMLRGIGADAVEENGRWQEDNLALESGCVEHWTTSPTAASNFGDGYIIVDDIPVNDILVANPVNSGTVMNLPESYVAREIETYNREDIYRAEEADALEFAERIVDSVN